MPPLFGFSVRSPVIVVLSTLGRVSRAAGMRFLEHVHRLSGLLNWICTDLADQSFLKDRVPVVIKGCLFKHLPPQLFPDQWPTPTVSSEATSMAWFRLVPCSPCPWGAMVGTMRWPLVAPQRVCFWSAR